MMLYVVYMHVNVKLFFYTYFGKLVHETKRKISTQKFSLWKSNLVVVLWEKSWASLLRSPTTPCKPQ